MKDSIQPQKVNLSKRQMDVAYEILKGNSTKAIAENLKLSPRTIETHINHLKCKFSCRNKTELIIKIANSLQYPNNLNDTP